MFKKFSSAEWRKRLLVRTKDLPKPPKSFRNKLLRKVRLVIDTTSIKVRILEPVCCKKQQKKFLTSYWLVDRGPLKVLNGIKLILDDQGNHLDSFTNKPITGKTPPFLIFRYWVYWFFFRDLLLCVCAKKMIDIMRGQTRTNGIFYSRAIGRVIASKGESKGGGPSYSFEGMAAP